MANPVWQEVTVPLLELAADGNEHSMAEAREVIAARLGLSEADRAERLSSGGRRFDNRVAWAKANLELAQLLSSPRRGFFKIIDRGRSVLNEKPQRVDMAVLNRFEEFRAAFRRSPGPGPVTTPTLGGIGVTEPGEAPEETLERAYQQVRTQLASDLLEKVKASSPEFFERLVVELLVKMGYGGSHADAGRAIGQVMRGSMGRLARTAWVSTQFTYRPNAGRAPSAVLKSRNSSEPYMGSALARESSSQPARSPLTPLIMSRISIRAWFSSAGGSSSSTCSTSISALPHAPRISSSGLTPTTSRKRHRWA